MSREREHVQSGWDRKRWRLAGFDRGSDSLVEEIPLDGVDLATLQALWGLPPTEPMVDCFPCVAEHLDALRPFIVGEVQLRPATVEYVLEPDVTPPSGW